MRNRVEILHCRDLKLISDRLCLRLNYSIVESVNHKFINIHIHINDLFFKFNLIFDKNRIQILLK